jgi:L-iditol 2-dehydrogenase
MKQAVMVEPGRIEYRDVDKPIPEADEVLVRVKRIGVCGSDIHVFHGKHPYTSYPVVQGHEVSGIIEQLGSEVKRFRKGQMVTFLPQLTCGKCYPCTHGMYHICNSLRVMGFQANGAAQEFFPVPENLVVPLPDSLSAEQGAMVEPTAVAVHALRRAGDITGKTALVLGAGPIGNLVAQSARGMGARYVMITDLSDFRLRVARECGVEHTINAGRQQLDEAIVQVFGEDRADVILECVGAQPTITQAVSNARKGSTIVVVGVFGEKPVIDVGLIQDRELNLVGTLMYQRMDYDKAIDLIRRNHINVNKLITDTFPFSAYLDAYRHIDGAKDKAIKVMITLD